MDGYVFGYGSLVNARTHDYAALHPAKVRRWCHAVGRRWAFLAVAPAPGAVLDGVIAEVPGPAWAALDEREFSYDRVETPDVEHMLPGVVRVQHYWVPDDKHAAPDAAEPVLLSYLDTCVEGYLEVFGETGPARFFETTDGWEAPIYRRHTAPGAGVRAVTDAALARLGVRRLSLGSAPFRA